MRSLAGFALLLFAVGLTASAAGAVTASLAWHEITVVVDLNGQASVREQFFFLFPTADSLKEFEITVRQNGVDLAKWQRFNPAIYPHLGREDQIDHGVLTINPDPSNPSQRVIELAYQLVPPLALPVDTRSERLLRFEINSEKNKGILVPFKVGSLIQIPADTQLRLELPSGAIVEETVPVPAQRPADNLLVWQDAQSNQFRVVYSIRQQVKSINLTQQLREFIYTPAGGLALGLAIISLIVGFIYRRPIGTRVEDFLVSHTEPIDKTDGKEKNEEAE